MQTSEQIVRSHDVIGVDVKNIQDEGLGKVEEIVLDKVKGNVRYVVLASGGFLGIGEKYFAIPWKALSYNKDQQAFALNISKEKLVNAPGFNKDQWPNFTDQAWEKSVYQYYNTTPHWEEL